MKLENLGKNQTRVIAQIPQPDADWTWDKDIYFSYGKPVLIVNYRDATVPVSYTHLTLTTILLV